MAKRTIRKVKGVLTKRFTFSNALENVIKTTQTGDFNWLKFPTAKALDRGL